MPDELDDFFRCVANGDRWEFQVGVVEWHSAHTPDLAWKTYRTWRTEPDAKRLANARSSALRMERFFRTCTRCGELHNSGHMDDGQTCQGCAARYLGAVY